jgi:hypothetical protein
MCGSFESRFNRCDESEVNAAPLHRACPSRVNLDSPEKCAVFCNSDEPAVTVSRKGAVTINCGRSARDAADPNRRVGKAKRAHV